MIDWNDNAMSAIHKFYEYLDEQGMWYANKEGCMKEFFDWLDTETKESEPEGNQEGEKWTHIVNFGFSEQATCKIISQCGDYVWVQVDGAGCPSTYNKRELKPIKPTIKPSEAWSLVSEQGWSVYEVNEKYDVVVKD